MITIWSTCQQDKRKILIIQSQWKFGEVENGKMQKPNTEMEAWKQEEKLEGV